MDPFLREALRACPDDDELEIILKLRPGHAPPPDVRVVARFGEVVTARIRPTAVETACNHRAIERMMAARPLVNDLARLAPPTRHDLYTRHLRRRRNVTGRGAIVAAVDFGIDVAHPHFRHADGTTRLLAVWDQRDASNTTNGYGYGRIHHQRDIDEALASEDPYSILGYDPSDADRGLGAHGTHVLDIAAGNGSLPGSLPGVAPEADLIFVHLSTKHTRGLGDLGDSVRLLEALDFIFGVAGDRPCVVNLSIGGMGGPHDGLKPVELAMDHLLSSRPGRAICQSAGNYFRSRTHATGVLRNGGKRRLGWIIRRGDRTRNELEIWYQGRGQLKVRLRSPGGLSFTADFGRDTPVRIGRVEVGRIYHRRSESHFDSNHVDIFLDPDAPIGRWSIFLEASPDADIEFHSWIERDSRGRNQSVFAHRDVARTTTLGTICTGHLPIAVSAYDGTRWHRPPARFSSSGPTRDGRTKPDVAAPGVAILAARSTLADRTPGSGTLVRQSGASMAAPHVTGAVALLFEAAPEPLSIEQTRRVLLSKASEAPPHLADRFGSGFLDIDGALSADNKPRSSACCSHFNEGNPMDTNISTERAAQLFDALTSREQQTADGFEIVAKPRQRLLEPLRAGDIIIRRALGEGSIGSADEIESAVGIEESEAEGVYVRTRNPKGSRLIRVSDRNGFLPSHHLIVRRANQTEGGGAVALGALASVGGDLAGQFLGPIFRRLGERAAPVVIGGYTIEATGASNQYQQTPPGLCVYRRVSRIRMTLRHRTPMPDDHAIFRVTQTFNGYGIGGATIDFEQASSSTLLVSTLRLRFSPEPFGAAADPIRGIVFNISGRWDPAGIGDVDLSGRLIVRGNGQLSLRMSRAGGLVSARLVRGRPRLISGSSCRNAAAQSPQPSPPNIQTRPGRRWQPRRRFGSTQAPQRRRGGLDVYFANGSSRLDQASQQAVVSWFQSLPDIAKNQLRAGAWTTRLTGFASPEGNARTNMLLSRRRSQSIASLLRMVIGGGAQFEIAARGEFAGVGEPAATARRVEIRIPQLVS